MLALGLSSEKNKVPVTWNEPKMDQTSLQEEWGAKEQREGRAELKPPQRWFNYCSNRRNVRTKTFINSTEAS